MLYGALYVLWASLLVWCLSALEHSSCFLCQLNAAVQLLSYAQAPLRCCAWLLRTAAVHA
jgi:hypothetical protein